MGNALVDIMTKLENDAVLDEFNLPKGSMTLVDLELSNKINIHSSTLNKIKASGGSAANTMHGLARLGIDSTFIGKIGNDDLGKFFSNDMKKAGIHTVLYQSMNDTGKVVALVSPDSERTMATFLGAAVELSAEDITSDVFTDQDIFYIEGYLVNNFELFSKSIRLAKNKGARIAMDLASFNVVEQYKNELSEELVNFVDIVFANEDEAKTISGLEPQQAVKALAELCEIAVVKTGAHGSLVMKGDELIHIPAIQVDSIDTTGAGDIYAAGFIYGLSKNLSLKKCGEIGTLLASKVIQVIGPKLSSKTWKIILEELQELINS